MADVILKEKSPTSDTNGVKIRVCPNCRSGQRTRRISRPLWMRIFSGSVNMACGQCGHRFWCLS